MQTQNRTIILFIVAVLIILGVFWVKKDKISFFNKEPDLVLKVDVNLSETDRAFVKKRLAENEGKLMKLDEEATLIEKVNLNFVISADYRLLGEYGKAKQVLDEITVLDPLNSNIMSVYSSLLSLMGDKKGALDYINKAISLYPLEENYWRWKIDLEKDTGKSIKELESIYKDALMQTKNGLNLVTYYAKFLEEQKRYDEAITKWQEAIKIEPSLEAVYQAEIDILRGKI